jgi:hypothetical protein
MTKIKPYFPPTLVLFGALTALFTLASVLGEQVEMRGRDLAARGLSEAQNLFHSQAQDLLGEASELARLGSLPAPVAGKKTLRWQLNKDGKLTEGYGVGFEAGQPDLHAMGAVERALGGVASDSIVFLDSDDGRWWHLAAAPMEKMGRVAGVMVVGLPLTLTAKGLSEQMAALTAASGMLTSAVLIAGQKVLSGKLSGDLKSMLKAGRADGSVKGLGRADLGLPVNAPAQRLVAGNVIFTEGGRLVVGAVVDGRKNYAVVAGKLKLAIGFIAGFFFFALVVVFFQSRRQQQAGETLITWLHTWRSSGAGAPVESLGLPEGLERVARNLDLTLAGAVGAAPNVISDVPGAFVSEPAEDGAHDFEQFSASTVFDAVSATTQTSSAGAINLFDGLDDTSTKIEPLPPLPTDLPAPPLASALPAPLRASPVTALPPLPAAGLAGKAISDNSVIAPVNPEGMFEDAPTGQFEVPDSLLLQISGDLSMNSIELDPRRALFEEYIALRQRLGEDVDGLTQERFEKKLDSSRAKIMEETGAKDVRFTVREKNGSASLRALPITD